MRKLKKEEKNHSESVLKIFFIGTVLESIMKVLHSKLGNLATEFKGYKTEQY